MLVGLDLSTGTVTPVRADEPTPHRVTYTVTTQQAASADIYYRDVDPPTWAEYSHNPYQFSPKDDVALQPGMPWIREVTLADPQRWAMVAVGVTPAMPAGTRTVRCQLAVDGVVVNRSEGPNGVLCSLRPW